MPLPGGTGIGDSEGPSRRLTPEREQGHRHAVSFSQTNGVSAKLPGGWRSLWPEWHTWRSHGDALRPSAGLAICLVGRILGMVGTVHWGHGGVPAWPRVPKIKGTHMVPRRAAGSGWPSHPAVADAPLPETMLAA